MFKKLIYLISCVLVVSIVSTSYGQDLIGNWENVMDGWIIDPCAPAGTTTSYSTTGVTLDTKSLKLDVPQSGWNQALTILLNDEGLVDEFFDNDAFSLNITRLASEWTGDPCNGWSDIQVIINAESDSGSVWINLGNDNSSWTYNDGDETTTARWSYAAAKAQIDESSISYLNIILASNYDPNYTSGGVYYLDNARLEPISYLNVIGNFENAMDGWIHVDVNDVNIATSYSTTGVTLDSHSLRIDSNEFWHQAVLYSMTDNNMIDTFRNNLKLSVDITRQAADWEPNESMWNELFVVVQAGSSADPNWDIWSQLATEADWAPGDGNEPKNFIYDYSTTLNEIDFDNLEYLNFIICTNWGGYDPGGVYYVDNIYFFGGGPAYDPEPANGERGVWNDAILSWTPGIYADKHDVYFGTSYNAVNDASRASPQGVLVEQNYDSNSYDPGELTFGKTYYWRIDEVNDTTFWKGEVWSFTTAYLGTGVVIGDWEDTMDGWVADSSATPSYSTTGATLNDKSLRLDVASGFHWVLMLALSAEQLEALKANDTFSLDVTWVTSEWGEGGTWAQVQWIAINSGATGWAQVDGPTSDTSNPGSPGEWNPYDFGEVDTRTITWNYSDIDVNSIEEGGWCFFQFATNHDAGFGTAPYYFDNARFIDSRLASNPNPPNNEKDVETGPLLVWKSGSTAVTHDVYFGTDYGDVNDASRTSDPHSVLVKQDHDTNSIYITDEVGKLAFETTYYWRIDEVNGLNIWQGEVWRFTTGRYLVVDNFESYELNPGLPNTWNTNTKATVSLSTEPMLVHKGIKAMALEYNNTTASPYYSEAYADTTGTDSLGFGTDWTLEGVRALSLWFRGYPNVDGTFTENSATSFTIEADGADIWNESDSFHYAYKSLTIGPASIKARIDSIEQTSSWAKAGVMMRWKLDADERHADIVMTPGNGVSFQYRAEKGGVSENVFDANFVVPYWVRLTLDDYFGGTLGFRAEHSSNGSTWTQIGEDLLITPLPSSMYIGLCVSSNTSGDLCTANFSNVSMTGSVSGDWQSQDIGVISNSPEPIYVVLEDSDSDAVVYIDDPNATTTTSWTEWRIDMNDFTDVSRTDVQRIYVGVGTRGNTTTADGTGTLFIDDIRLYPPECYAPKLPSWPPDLVRDCLIDYFDLQVLADNWLQTPSDPSVNLSDGASIDFKDVAELGKSWGEEQAWWPSW